MRYNPLKQTVLALETSCDESAVAVVRRNGKKLDLLASGIASQVEEHSKWGGVVPEIASRMHLEVLPSLLENVLDKFEEGIEGIDAIAATVAPGLSGALLVGSVTARTLSSLHQVPFLGVHHLEGHLASVALSDDPPKTPYLVLLISGGHTELIHVEKACLYRRLGRSHDDAAGEAFDKVARLLGLAYPGGPAIQRLAEFGDPLRFSLPKGRVSKPGGGFYPYDFSFSGLKTAMLRKVEDLKLLKEPLPVNDLAASFENVVAEVLVQRSLHCAKEEGLKRLVMVGGVAANKRLREMMSHAASKASIELHIAPKAFCTDNAAMIGAAALMRLELGVTSSSCELGVAPRLSLENSQMLYESPPPF